jgi:hypothetical protein
VEMVTGDGEMTKLIAIQSPLSSESSPSSALSLSALAAALAIAYSMKVCTCGLRCSTGAAH